MVGPKSHCSMRKLALQGTEKGETTLRAQRGRLSWIRLWASKDRRHLCGEALLERGWCHCCTFVTYEHTDMCFFRRLLGSDCSSSARQTTDCESVRRVTSDSLLGLFLPTDALSVRPCCAVSHWQTLPSWGNNFLAPSSWTFTTMRSTLLLLKPHSQ